MGLQAESALDGKNGSTGTCGRTGKDGKNDKNGKVGVDGKKTTGGARRQGRKTPGKRSTRCGRQPSLSDLLHVSKQHAVLSSRPFQCCL